MLNSKANTYYCVTVMSADESLYFIILPSKYASNLKYTRI